MELADRDDALLFDLDGTLTDPFIGITRSIAHAMERMGRIAPAADDLRWCIGPPLQESFKTLLQTEDAGLMNEAVAFYRERYAAVGKFENKLIPGITQMLEQCATSGAFLSVATSKVETYTGDILEHFGLSGYFNAVHGSKPDGRNANKADLIRHILETESLDPRHTIMIGDRSHDMVGASANGVRAIGVLWGYGDRAELERAGAASIAERPGDLMSLIRNLVPQA